MTRPSDHVYVALKIFQQGDTGREEFQTYEHLSKANPSHPGY